MDGVDLDSAVSRPRDETQGRAKVRVVLGSSGAGDGPGVVWAGRCPGWWAGLGKVASAPGGTKSGGKLGRSRVVASEAVAQVRRVESGCRTSPGAGARVGGELGRLCGQAGGLGRLALAPGE